MRRPSPIMSAPALLSRDAHLSTTLMLVVVLACGSLTACASQVASYSLSDLEGAWWSEGDSPTAEFAIAGDEIWLDYDAGYHPCRIVGGDTLIYDLGPDLGVIERRIVSLVGDVLVLESTASGETVRTTYRR